MINFLSIIAIFLCYKLFSMVSGKRMSILHLNIYSFIFWIQICLVTILGLLMIVNNISPMYYSDKDKIFTYSAVFYSIIMLPVSMYMVSWYFQFNPYLEINSYYDSEVETYVTNEDSYVFYIVLFLSIISFLSIIYTFVISDKVPLLELIKGSSVDKLKLLRVSVSQDFKGMIYLKNFFSLTLMPVLSYISFSYLFVKNINSYRWFVLFIIQFLLSLLINFFTLAKLPPIAYLISFVALIILIQGGINKKKVILSYFGIICCIIILFIFITGYDRITSILDVSSGPLFRILFAQIDGLFKHFKLFPEVKHFLWGGGFPEIIANFLNKEHAVSSRMVMEYFYPIYVKKGFSNVMNTFFIGEAWANFSYYGIILSPIYVGFIIQYFMIKLYRTKKTPLNLGLFCYCIFYFGWNINGGFIAYLYNTNFILIFLLIILIKISTNFIIFNQNE